MSPPSSASMSGETRHRPAHKLPGRRVAGETVVVDPRKRQVFVMNTVAGVVWAGVERQASTEEIVAEVVARFRVTEAQARTDVDAFLSELQVAGLAEKVGA
jgi:hypothetical protein